VAVAGLGAQTKAPSIDAPAARRSTRRRELRELRAIVFALRIVE
jgi:hypothetical protein